MQVIFYEDDKVESLYPITLMRPAFSILCGGATLYDLTRLFLPAAAISYRVRDYLKAVTGWRYGKKAKAAGNVLLLSADLAPSASPLQKLIPRIKAGESFKLKSQDEIIGSYLTAADR